MRRQSPSRSMRFRSPPRKRGGGRSLSPLSKSQPAPPGEERNRKSRWDTSNKRRRYSSRSRSREWTDREPPFINLNDQDRSKRRDLPKDRDMDKRDRNRNRNTDIKDSKPKPYQNRMRDSQQDYEESYLDRQEFYGSSGHVGHKSQENIILDPSTITLNSFDTNIRGDHSMQDNYRHEKHLDISKDHHTSARDYRHRSPQVDVRSQKVIHEKKSNFIEVKEESAAERINRLEKLVEKLVQGNKEPESKPAKARIPEFVPSNSKLTTSIWLNLVHEECLQKNYSDRSTIKFVQHQMTGIMKAWWKTVADIDFAWPELKTKIISVFPDNIDFAQTLRLLVMRDKKASENISEYYYSKLYLCECCKITGENAVSCLIDGLSNPFMKQDIKSMNFLSPEVLYAEYLSKFPENDLSRSEPRDHQSREVVPEYQDNDNFIPLEAEQEDVYQRNYITEEDSGDTRRCRTCNRIGHIAVNCRHAPICYNCNKKGHIAAKCHYQ